MDLSPALETHFNKLIAELSLGEPGVMADQVQPENKDLETMKLFFNFDEHPKFTGVFLGPGPVQTIKNTNVDTWLFADQENKDWLIPQWLVLNEEQGNFKGFQNEEKGRYIYFLHYKGLVTLDNGGSKHDIQIFRKLIDV